MSARERADAGGLSRQPLRVAVRRAVVGVAIVVAIAAFYGPLLDRGFTSEDFLLLRLLRQQPPWQDPVALFAGPWLGIDVVRFYRPLSVLLLAVEANLFAARPVPYELVHLALHAVCSLLVYLLARRLLAVPPAAEGDLGGRRLPASPLWPLVAALLFALHPMHPNAVAWIASYATLFAAAAVLGAAVAWERWRAGDRTADLVLATVLYAASLLCYEGAVLLPLALLLRELLLPGGPMSEPAPAADGAADADGDSPMRRRRLLALLPFLVLAAGYLLVRVALFGQAVGGYASFAERLAPAAMGRLAGDAARSLARLLVPPYASTPLVSWCVLAAVFLLPLLVPAATASARRRHLAVWAFCWGWMLIFLAPFAFQPFVPANGRFAYLASAGTALALAQLGRRGWGALRRTLHGPGGARPAVLAVLAVLLPLAVGIDGAWRLERTVGAMERAGGIAAQVRLSLAETVVRTAPGPLFVAGHPRFVTGERALPLAQVLRYGLADSVEPPFAAGKGAAAHGVLVYPLPEGPVSGAVAALGAERVVIWDEAAKTFRGAGASPGGRGVGAPPPTTPSRLDAVGPATATGTAAWHISYRPYPHATHRLVVVTRGNPVLVDLPVSGNAAPGISAGAELPESMVRSMRHLYAGPVYWWVEARGPGGRLLAVSPAQTLPEP